MGESLEILVGLFPHLDREILQQFLLSNEDDVDKVIDLLLDSSDSMLSVPSPSNPFDVLVNTFPAADVEAIEAFLVANPIEDQTLDSSVQEILCHEFMLQCSKDCSRTTSTKSRRNNDLKLSLQSFNSLVSDDSGRLSKQPFAHECVSANFEFSFLEPNDETAHVHDNGEYFRQQATLLQEERLEKFRKAANKYKSGDLTAAGSASFYAEEGRRLRAKIARLHRIAAEVFFLKLNPNFKTAKSLDLHHLRADEAHAVTSAFLKHHQRLGTKRVEIITGKGMHSSSGEGKLAPAIWNLLKCLWLNFSFDGSGSFNVFLM